VLKCIRSTICPYVRDLSLRVLLQMCVEVFWKFRDEFRIQFLYINLLKLIILCNKFHVVYNLNTVPINRLYGKRALLFRLVHVRYLQYMMPFKMKEFIKPCQ
jgi:hypothetical protein